MDWYESAKRIVDNALAEKEFLVKGQCSFQNKDKCKELGARWVDRTWAAKSEQSLLALADSGMWHPVGLPAEANIAIVLILRKRNAEREAADIAMRTTKAGPTAEEKEESMRKQAGVVADEPHLLQLLAFQGVGPEKIASTGEMAWLGPRCGISNAARFLRGVRFNLISVQALLDGTAVDPHQTGGQRRTAGVSAKRGFEAQAHTSSKRKRTSDEPAAGPKQEQPRKEECKAQGAAGMADGGAKAVKVVKERVYTTECVECGAVVDARKQFGLECDCAPLRVWKSCHACSTPFIPRSTSDCMCKACA